MCALAMIKNILVSELGLSAYHYQKIDALPCDSSPYGSTIQTLSLRDWLVYFQNIGMPKYRQVINFGTFLWYFGTYLVEGKKNS